MHARLLLLALIGTAVVPVITFAQSSGCGPPEAKFKVKPDKSGLSLKEKSMDAVTLMIVQDDTFFQHVPKPTTRIGIDSVWVGATQKGSYAIVTTEPGSHDLCIDWQNSIFSVGPGMKVAAKHLELKPRTTYYFRIRDVWKDERSSSVHQGDGYSPSALYLDQIDSAEGELLRSHNFKSIAIAK